MDYYLILGMVAAALIAISGFVWSIKKSTKEELETFQSLNLNIAKLNQNFEYMKEADQNRDKRIDKHGKEIDELKEQHRKELDAVKDQQKINEKILDRHELRIGNLEEKVNKGA